MRYFPILMVFLITIFVSCSKEYNVPALPQGTTPAPTATVTSTAISTSTATPTSTATATAVATATPINWTQATNSAAFSPRLGQGAVVYNGLMWIIGGDTSAGVTNDVWNSSDGVNWNLIQASAAFSPRFWFGCTVFNNRMWVIAGCNSIDNSFDDVWSSTDGITWTQATAAAAFSTRYGPQVLTYNAGAGTGLWLIGGDHFTSPSTYTDQSDVWYSTDGINWSNITASGGFPGRSNFGSCIFNNQMWISGGNSTDVWSSSNGVNWNMDTNSLPPLAYRTMEHQNLVFNSMIWVLGGWDAAGYNTLTWESPNGASWNSGGPAGFGQRRSHSGLIFNGEMWVIAGIDNNGVLKNDVWHSP